MARGVRAGKSDIRGKGLFAARDFYPGERIMRMTGRRVGDKEASRLIAKKRIRNDDPFEIGKGRYIILDPLPLLGNHSCRPNAGVRGENELVAIRRIREGEEITYDYSTVSGAPNEYETPWRMRCRCGAKNCRKVIGSWKTLPARRFRQYEGLGVIPRFVQREAR